MAERKVARIECASMLPQHNRKGSYATRPHHIREGTGFRAALQSTFVHRPEFVHVIGLVRATAGIEETVHTGNQQRAFVVGNRVGTGKHAARFAMKRFAIGKEERPFRGKLPTDTRPLTDKGLGDHRRTVDPSPFAQNEVVGLHAWPHMCRRFR